jgi:hypothetical protein
MAGRAAEMYLFALTPCQRLCEERLSSSPDDTILECSYFCYTDTKAERREKLVQVS